MKHIAITIFVLGIFLKPSIAEETKSFTPAEPYRFSANAPTCFLSDHLSGATYTKFTPDGQYVGIVKEHLGVWPFDNGSWSQSSDGTITLVSKELCADIICDPLEIDVGRHDLVGRLADLRRKVADLLASKPNDIYSQDDLKPLAIGGSSLKVAISWQARRKTVTHQEMCALLSAMDHFINDPSIRNQRLMPLEYKGKVFLVNLNGTINRDHKEVCESIDQGANSTMIIYNDFMISEQQFDQGTRKPYPFKFYRQMNKITGAE